MNHDDMRFIESIKYIPKGNAEVQTLDPKISPPGSIKRTKDGTYVVKHNPGWLRGNNRKDIVGSMIISPGCTGTFKKGVAIGFSHGITATLSTEFDFGFMKATISTAYGVTVDETVTVIHGITYTSPTNKYTYIRMFATYTKYEVIKVEDGQISRGFVFKGEGLYEKKIEYNEGDIVDQELLDENAERCIFDGSQAVTSIIDSTEKLEPSVVVSNSTFTHETQLYTENVSLNIPFTVSSNGYYQIDNANGKNHMILYKIVNIGSLQKPIKNIIANSPGYEFGSSKSSILANLRIGDSYLLVIPKLKNGKDTLTFKKTSGSISGLQNCGFVRDMTLPDFYTTYKLQFDKVGSRLALDLSADAFTRTYRIYTRKGICKVSLYEYNIGNSSITKVNDFMVKFESQDIQFQANKRYILILTNEGSFYGSTDLILRNNVDGNYKISTSLDQSKSVMREDTDIFIKSYAGSANYQWRLRLNAIENGYEIVSIANKNDYLVWEKITGKIKICTKRNLSNIHDYIWELDKLESDTFRIRNNEDEKNVIALKRNTNIEGSELTLKNDDSNDDSKFILTLLSL